MRALPLLAALVCAPSAALAGDALKLELVPKAMEGEGSPAIVVRAEAALAKVVLDVKRSTDGKRVKLEAGPIAAGRTHRFELEQKKRGKASYSGKLSVETGDGGSGEMPINVDVEVVPPLSLKVDPKGVDLAKRTLLLTADRDMARAQITVMSDTGTPMGTTETDWDKTVQPAGTSAPVTWKQSAGTVMRITVQGWDADGFFGAVDLFPWRVDIPHEEVNFATGSHDIRPEEVKKLEASFELIKGAVEKYGKLATIKLFIGGHTDTVGDNASNLGLSERRARSIGGWFAKRGVALPISYAGFGEEMLAVKTPDETDEAKNRRAEYIVAVDPPPISGRTWQPLR